MITDKIFLDVNLSKRGIRIYLNTIEKLTGVPHWITLKAICPKGEFIFHLCLSRINQQWNLTVTYKDKMKKFIKQNGGWIEVE